MSNNMQEQIKIKCPHCGCEYFPAEIYIPKSFLGQPEDIIRNNDGQIEFFSGDNMNLIEEYTCDHCGCLFKSIGNIEFKTEIIEAPIEDDTIYVVNIE